MRPAWGAMMAIGSPAGDRSTALRYRSTSRTSAPGLAGYQLPATAARRSAGRDMNLDLGRMVASGVPERLTRADVDRIAALARLELSDTEKDQFVRQLADVLEYADQIQAIDTTDV